MLLLLLFVLLIFLVEVRVLTYAYRKVGVHPGYAFAVLLLSLIGSHVNIPLFAMAPADGARPTVVMLNVGGALIPILVSIYLLARTGMFARMAIGTAVIAVILYNPPEILPGLRLRGPLIAPPPLPPA